MSTPVTENGWKTVPLSAVVRINPRPAKDDLQDDQLASFIPMKCVEEESGRFTPLEDKRVAEVRKGYTPFRDGDVIFAKVTPCMENGKAAVMKGLTNGIGFGSTEFFTLRPNDELDGNYLFHFILQENFRREAARNMTGAVGLRRVPKQYLEQQTIPLPPLDEQRRIVSEIEKQFTRLDAGVSALQRVRSKLKQYRAAVLKAACEGRLVPTEAELARAQNRDYQSAEVLLERILQERRAKWNGRGKYSEPAPPSTPDLPPLPEGWVWASLRSLTLALGDGLHGTPKYSEGTNCHFINGNNLADGRIVIKSHTKTVCDQEAQKHRKPMTLNTVLVSINGTLGSVAFYNDEDVILGKSVCYLNLVGTINKHFVRWVLESPYFTNYALANATGSTIRNLGLTAMNCFSFPLPPLAEQERIVAEVERRLSVVDELEATVTANLQRAARLRQAILQKAFNGD